MSAIVYAYNIDNFGNMVPLPHTAAPELASGQTLTATNKDTNYTATVTTGVAYVVTAVGGAFFFSMTGTVVTAANKEWVCGNGSKIIIFVPKISTGAVTRTLNYGSDTDAAKAYIVKCAQRE
jgi:hypothetical protein